MKKKRFTVENFLTLSANDVYRHVQLLYQQLTKQNKKIKKLRLKIKKIVRAHKCKMI